MVDVMHAAADCKPPTSREADLDPVQHLLGAREGAGRRSSDLGRCSTSNKRGADRGGQLRRQPGWWRSSSAPLRGRRVRPADPAPPARMLAECPRTSPVDINFPRSRKFDHLSPGAGRRRLGLCPIMEGCNKYCSYCVVPCTRGDEINRPVRDVLVEVAGPGRPGREGGRCWARTSTPTAARWATPPESPTSRC